MSDSISADIKGLDEVFENMEKFKGNSLRRIISRSSRASMKETRKKAKANAKAFDNPKTPNNISKDIMTKVNTKKFSRTGVITAKVGVRGGAKKDKNDVYYWRFLEFGTSKMAARPFLRPAMNPEQIQSAFAKETMASIEKEVKKYGDPR